MEYSVRKPPFVTSNIALKFAMKCSAEGDYIHFAQTCADTMRNFNQQKITPTMTKLIIQHKTGCSRYQPPPDFADISSHNLNRPRAG